MAKTAIRYEIHDGSWMKGAYEKKFPEKTGRTLEEWVRIVKKHGPAGTAERRRWLKAEHRLPTMYAWWAAAAAEGRSMAADAWDPEANVRDLYAGPKAALLPLHDRLCRLALSLGKDVKIAPCETMVPFFRKFAFAELRPATATRLDLGLALGTAKPSGRLEAQPRSGGNRITHRISLGSLDEIDAEVERRLREAYEMGNDTRRREAPPKTLPADLAAVLKRSAKARETFESLTDRMRADWISWITEPKSADTRARRVERAAERLGQGHKRNY